MTPTELMSARAELIKTLTSELKMASDAGDAEPIGVAPAELYDLLALAAAGLERQMVVHHLGGSHPMQMVKDVEECARKAAERLRLRYSVVLACDKDGPLVLGINEVPAPSVYQILSTGAQRVLQLLSPVELEQLRRGGFRL